MVGFFVQFGVKKLTLKSGRLNALRDVLFRSQYAREYRMVNNVFISDVDDTFPFDLEWERINYLDP